MLPLNRRYTSTFTKYYYIIWKLRITTRAQSLCVDNDDVSFIRRIQHIQSDTFYGNVAWALKVRWSAFETFSFVANVLASLMQSSVLSSAIAVLLSRVSQSCTEMVILTWKRTHWFINWVRFMLFVVFVWKYTLSGISPSRREWRKVWGSYFPLCTLRFWNMNLHKFL